MGTADPKGSFVRWQAVVIAQLTYAVNLVLSFAVATLGFQATLLLNDKFTLACAWQKYAFGLSLFLVSTSIAFGIWVVVNRLCDFRATRDAARLREEGAGDSSIEPYRQEYRKLGANTWRLFWWQLGTFGVGTLLSVVTVVGMTVRKFL
jgi:hypothetical protein